MAKNKTTARPIGGERLQRIRVQAERLAPRVRSAEGLARALLAIYTPKLGTAEDMLQHMGGRPSDDNGEAYRRHMHRTQELRGLVAIATAATNDLDAATLDLEGMEILTRNLGGGK